MNHLEDIVAMSPNKSKKGGGSLGTHEPSPETPGPSGKRSSSHSEDDDEDYIPPKKGKMSSSKLSSKAGKGMRSPVFPSHNKPAELFRKDLISAMKLPDTDPLQAEDYVLIQDPWRQEWERGVQVPVNPTELQVSNVKEVENMIELKDFKMPRKYLHGAQDETYRQGIHELTGMQQLSEQVVRYDMDDLDVCWLNRVNEEREEMGLPVIHEWTLERVIEVLENQCHDQMTNLMKSEEVLGIEYDADVACDVCRTKEGEDGNEMVFCDGCNMCVHQACYGIQTIPTGDWLCRTCALGIYPECVLCPNTGGAMKSTRCSSQVELLVDFINKRSGSKWAHVSCALWIPEVSIGVPEKMEPITKISAIPPSRWSLVCCICKKKQGACIQCSVKTCKTAFHVTCGMKGGLTFKTVLEDDTVDGVKLRAYCPKHSKRGGEEPDSPSKDPKDMTSEEKETYRKQKLEELKEAFYTVIDCTEVAKQVQLEEEVVSLIFNYWKLKRKTNFNEPLLLPKADEAEVLENRQEKTIQSRMRMFVHLRQDLERVRNLCYMVSKREKMKRQYCNSHETLFKRLNEVLSDKNINLSAREAERLAREFKTIVSPVVQPQSLLPRLPAHGGRGGRKKRSSAGNSNNNNHEASSLLFEENSNMTGDADSRDASSFGQALPLAPDSDAQLSSHYESSEDDPSPPQLSPRVDENPLPASSADEDDAISCPDSVVGGVDEQKEEEEEEQVQSVKSPPVASSPITSPAVASPPAVSPSAVSPSAGSPSAGSPSAGSPSAGSPSAGSPSAGSPPAGSPSAGSPAGSPHAGSPPAVSPSTTSASSESGGKGYAVAPSPRMKLSRYMKVRSSNGSNGETASREKLPKARRGMRRRRGHAGARKRERKPESPEVKDQSTGSESEQVWLSVPSITPGRRIKLSLTKRHPSSIKKEKVESPAAEAGDGGAEGEAASRHLDRAEVRQGRGSGISKHTQLVKKDAVDTAEDSSAGVLQTMQDVRAEMGCLDSLGESLRALRGSRTHQQPEEEKNVERAEVKEEVEEQEEERTDSRTSRQNGKLLRIEERQLRATRPRAVSKLKLRSRIHAADQKCDPRLSEKKESLESLPDRREKATSKEPSDNAPSDPLLSLFGERELKFPEEAKVNLQNCFAGIGSRLRQTFNGHAPHEIPSSNMWKMDKYGRVKLDSRGKPLLNSGQPPRSSARVLNEIPADKGKKTENVCGVGPPSRGSLGDYRIPKKSSASAAGSAPRAAGRTPQQDSLLVRSSSGEGRDWPHHTASVLSPSDLRGVKMNIFGEFEGFSPSADTPDFRSLHQGPVDAAPRTGTYRSQSPLSDEGEPERRDFSRESTPRRVTRSQHLDPDENSLGHSPSKSSASPLRLKESLLKSPKFS